jgi:phospholipid transport system transporter-binding protein
LVTAVKVQPQLTIDASALQQFDSSALAVLLAGMREAQALGGQLQVQGLPARARSLVQVYGLTEVLQLPPVPA